MDLSITVNVTTGEMPDAEEIAKMIPQAFTALAPDIKVNSVSISMTPVHYAPEGDPNLPPAANTQGA